MNMKLFLKIGRLKLLIIGLQKGLTSFLGAALLSPVCSIEYFAAPPVQEGYEVVVQD